MLSFELLFDPRIDAVRSRPAARGAARASTLCAWPAHRRAPAPNASFHFVGSPMAIEFLLGIVVVQLPRRACVWPANPRRHRCADPATAAPETGLIAAALDPGTRRCGGWCNGGFPAARQSCGARCRWSRCSSTACSTCPWQSATPSIFRSTLFHPLVAYGFDLPFSPWLARLLFSAPGGSGGSCTSSSNAGSWRSFGEAARGDRTCDFTRFRKGHLTKLDAGK